MKFQIQLLQRYSTLILILLIVAAGTMGFTFALRPALDGYQTSRAGLNNFSQNYETAKLRFEKLQGLETDLKRFSAGEIEKLDYFFVPAPEMAYLLSLIENRTKAARFLLTSLNVGQGARDKDTSSVDDINIQMQLKGGGYDEFKELLKLLTRAVPLIDVSSFTFDSREAGASVNLKAHRLKNDLPPSAAPVDVNFFADPRFSALSSPVLLPDTAPVGRADPFAPITE